MRRTKRRRRRRKKKKKKKKKKRRRRMKEEEGLYVTIDDQWESWYIRKPRVVFDGGRGGGG